MIDKVDNGFAVKLPTESWYGGRRYDYLYNLRDYEFPSSWNIEVFEPDGVEAMRPLADEEVRKQLGNAIGTESLRKMAEGRKNAVIIVDDLSRPTPAYAVVPAILDELKAGGVSGEKVKIIIGLGTHRPISIAEQRRKLGKDVVARVEVINHNCFTRRLTTFQRPNGGPDFKINRVVGEADLKISVSGVVAHGGAGFGGGAKAILPSVASYDTIMYNHQTFAWEGYGIVYPEKITSECIRKDMELCARAAGLDFSVNLVFSPLKDVLGVFAGDFIKAHRKGSKFAKGLYLTRVPAEKMDVVIAGGYPLDSDIGQSHRGTWPEKYGEQSVLLAGARDGWAYHGDNGKSYRTYRRLKRTQLVDSYKFKGTGDSQEHTGFYYSPVLSPETFYERDAKRVFFNEWESLVSAMNGTGRDTTVGIFPYASMQVENGV
jgi:nickel-dependent lactate racemase